MQKTELVELTNRTLGPLARYTFKRRLMTLSVVHSEAGL